MTNFEKIKDNMTPERLAGALYMLYTQDSKWCNKMLNCVRSDKEECIKCIANWPNKETIDIDDTVNNLI